MEKKSIINDNYGKYCSIINQTCQERCDCIECQAYLDALDTTVNNMERIV